MPLNALYPTGAAAETGGHTVVLLDTTALVDLGRRADTVGHRRVRMVLRELLLRGETLFTSRINDAEFRVGPEMSDQRQRELERVERVLSGIAILEFDAHASQYYAVIKSAMFKSGRPAGDCDAMIAAVSLAHGQVLLTRNRRHFENIAGLVVQSY